LGVYFRSSTADRWLWLCILLVAGISKAGRNSAVGNRESVGFLPCCGVCDCFHLLFGARGLWLPYFVAKPTLFSFTFVVRQIMPQSSNSFQRRGHFCFDANPYSTRRRGLRRNRNVWRSVLSNVSHFGVESTLPNTTLEPTAVMILRQTLQTGACKFSGRGSALRR
jgi:hypothetical protein